MYSSPDSACASKILSGVLSGLCMSALLAHLPAEARETEVAGSLPVTVLERAALEQLPGRSAEQILSLDKLPVNINVMGPPGKSFTVRGYTDPQGNVPFTTEPAGEWLPRDAVEGVSVVLPADALISVYGQDSAAGAVNIITRRAYGIRDGQLTTPEAWSIDKLEPFTLRCRADEGLPDSLPAGEALSYRVPGPREKLDLVLDASYVYQPRSYRLPEGLGYGVTSQAGPDPQQTWSELKQLETRGLITDLEWDPCWKFLPESPHTSGCQSGVRTFEEKAVRYEGPSLGASLKASYTGKALAGAWFLYEPELPTPFANPGERPGDDRPPLYTRSDANGTYRAPLDGLSGPLQVGVAKGCEEHSTMVIANAPATAPGKAAPGTATPAPPATGATGPTVSHPTPATTTPPPPASTPRKPQEGEMICGPDVTDHVLQVLKLIEDRYHQWDYATQTARCLVLYSPIHFRAAWDMQLFAPSDGEDFMQHIFFQRAAPGYCAVPRWPCGPTVKFLGYCINAQVVNYLQWGLMNQLCDNQGVGMLSHLLRSGVTPDYTGQEAMAAIGQAFGSTERDMAYRKRFMKIYLDYKVRENQNGWYGMEGTQCAMTCDEVATGAREWLNNAGWGYQWGPASGDSVWTLRQERQQEELKQLELKRKREGRQ